MSPFQTPLFLTCTVPVVQFSVAELETLEPLSNTALDSSPLQLEVVREGDSSRVSNISYHTADLSAQSGQDYEHVTGVLEFESGSTRKEVNVSILPNPQQTLNTTFEVRLSLPANHSSSDPTTLGDNSVITVTIRNLPYEGVYFPALPQVDNMEDGRRAGHAAGVYYDMPLMCITVWVHVLLESTYGDHMYQGQIQEGGVRGAFATLLSVS